MTACLVEVLQRDDAHFLACMRICTGHEACPNRALVQSACQYHLVLQPLICHGYMRLCCACNALSVSRHASDQTHSCRRTMGTRVQNMPASSVAPPPAALKISAAM